MTNTRATSRLVDGILDKFEIERESDDRMVGGIFKGRVKNLDPGLKAAFVDIGRGRNAVLYAGEVDWASFNVSGEDRKVEKVLKSGQTILVQVTKDPIGHKGARLTSQVTLAGRFLVLVPSGGMTGVSRKLSERERSRLKNIVSKMILEL